MEILAHHELEEMFDDMINECQEPVKIGNIILEPATVLYKCDPIAYREGLYDYLDGLVQDGYLIQNENGDFGYADD